MADEGSVLLAADYSQVELRILAHISQDESLIETFKRGADIHRATAAKMFGVSEEELTHDQRLFMSSVTARAGAGSGEVSRSGESGGSAS